MTTDSGEVSWTVWNLLAYLSFFAQLGALVTGFLARNRSGYVAMCLAAPLLVLGYLILLVGSAGFRFPGPAALPPGRRCPSPRYRRLAVTFQFSRPPKTGLSAP